MGASAGKGEPGAAGVRPQPLEAGRGNYPDAKRPPPSEHHLSSHGSEASLSTIASSSHPSGSSTSHGPAKAKGRPLYALHNQGLVVAHKHGQPRKPVQSSPGMPMVHGTQGNSQNQTPPPSRPDTAASIASVAVTMAQSNKHPEVYRQRAARPELPELTIPGQLPDFDFADPQPPNSQPATLAFRLRPGTSQSQLLAQPRPSSTASGSGGKENGVGTLQQPFALPIAVTRRSVHAGNAQGRHRVESLGEAAVGRPASVGGTCHSSFNMPVEEDCRVRRPSVGGIRRAIRWVEDASHHYKLGGNVMPSCHSGMEVRHACRISMLPAEQEAGAKESLVVKVRYKNKSFQGRNDEQKWRTNTELLLNIPACNGIAQIYEVLEDPKAYYVIMERAGGCDLYECLAGAPEKRLSPHEVKIVLRELLMAVTELHRHGFIHKDLKLENVMLNRGSSTGPAQLRRNLATCPSAGVKLIDFDTVEEWSAEIPKARHVLGTDQYIAPEAYDGMYSPLSDVFAVGVIAYRLIAGTFPYNGRLFDDKPGENWVGSPKMREIKDKLCDAKVSWRHPIFDTEPGAQALLARMLAVRERDRPTAQDCLADPWLQPDIYKPPPAGKQQQQQQQPQQHVSVAAKVLHGSHQKHYLDAALRPATVHHVRGKAMVQQHQSQHDQAPGSQTLSAYLASPADNSQQRRKRHPTGSADTAGETKETWATTQ